ncbi:hypothetical protein Pint_13913 [Pistacia integerrima]|uniref:Uncharacterized protein n=1 Tax=Pistacia integerrima TaxID=434235 RepID=A0ACC0Y5F5_9ROSI|nr:hypothetical protein Pint_13913 [Pistacia integerrima]
MFCTALSYVTLRLLGEEVDGGDGAIEKARKWIIDRGGVMGKDDAFGMIACFFSI